MHCVKNLHLNTIIFKLLAFKTPFAASLQIWYKSTAAILYNVQCSEEGQGVLLAGVRERLEEQAGKIWEMETELENFLIENTGLQATPPETHTRTDKHCALIYDQLFLRWTDSHWLKNHLEKFLASHWMESCMEKEDSFSLAVKMFLHLVCFALAGKLCGKVRLFIIAWKAVWKR